MWWGKNGNNKRNLPLHFRGCLTFSHTSDLELISVMTEPFWKWMPWLRKWRHILRWYHLCNVATMSQLTLIFNVEQITIIQTKIFALESVPLFAVDFEILTAFTVPRKSVFVIILIWKLKSLPANFCGYEQDCYY